MRSFCSVLFLAGSMWTQCPPDAVFLGLTTGIRGFPLRANGNTTPCQAIPIPNLVGTSRSLAVSGDLPGRVVTHHRVLVG